MGSLGLNRDSAKALQHESRRPAMFSEHSTSSAALGADYSDRAMHSLAPVGVCSDCSTRWWVAAGGPTYSFRSMHCLSAAAEYLDRSTRSSVVAGEHSARSTHLWELAARKLARLP
jgi:hypothetical protein